MAQAFDLSLYLITDDQMLSFDQLLDKVSLALKAGVTMLQLRAKHSCKSTMLEQGRALQKICKQHEVKLLVNDDLEIAEALGSDGVHLGQDDLSPQLARERLGPQAIIGRSIQTISQARREAYAQFVDYYGVGPVFPTQSKQDVGKALGCLQLGIIETILQRPVVAIGGINLANMKSVLATGVDGVAVISAILQADDVTSATRQMKQIIAQRQLP